MTETEVAAQAHPPPASSVPPAAPVAVRVDGVGKVYPQQSYKNLFGGSAGRATRALSDVSFEIRQGETLGLLGPNGAGKTTLLKILSTALQPTEGQVLLDGKDIAADPRHARGRLGLVTCDERSFYWRLSALRNLSFFAALYQVPEKVAQERIGILLEALGLTYAAHRPFHSYSSGMKQKLAIARGLLAEPDLVLYDEPTRSLDPLSAANIRAWLVENRKKNPKRTHLIATNQLNEAEQLCDRVVIINHGQLIASGTVAQIRRDWSGDAYRIHRVTYCGEDVTLDSLGEGFHIETESTDDSGTTIRIDSQGRADALSTVMAAILGQGGVVIACRSEEASFDEIFCSMVEGSGKKPLTGAALS